MGPGSKKDHGVETGLSGRRLDDVDWTETLSPQFRTQAQLASLRAAVVSARIARVFGRDKVSQHFLKIADLTVKFIQRNEAPAMARALLGIIRKDAPLRFWAARGLQGREEGWITETLCDLLDSPKRAIAKAAAIGLRGTENHVAQEKLLGLLMQEGTQHLEAPVLDALEAIPTLPPTYQTELYDPQTPHRGAKEALCEAAHMMLVSQSEWGEGVKKLEDIYRRLERIGVPQDEARGEMLRVLVDKVFLNSDYSFGVPTTVTYVPNDFIIKVYLDGHLNENHFLAVRSLLTQQLPYINRENNDLPWDTIEFGLWILSYDESRATSEVLNNYRKVTHSFYVANHLDRIVEEVIERRACFFPSTGHELFLQWFFDPGAGKLPINSHSFDHLMVSFFTYPALAPLSTLFSRLPIESALKEIDIHYSLCERDMHDLLIKACAKPEARETIRKALRANDLQQWGDYGRQWRYLATVETDEFAGSIVPVNSSL